MLSVLSPVCPSESDIDNEYSLSIKFKNAEACVIDSKKTELNGQIIMKSFSSFKGANISLISIDSVS